MRPSIDSDLGALQPYFFGSYGYRSVAIFRVHAAEWKAIMLTHWKDFRSVEKVVVLASEVALPSVLAPGSGVVHSLGVWFAELEVNDLPALDSSCDPDKVWRFIFRFERTLPYWGSLEVCQWPREVEMQRRKQHSFFFASIYFTRMAR